MVLILSTDAKQEQFKETSLLPPSSHCSSKPISSIIQRNQTKIKIDYVAYTLSSKN